MLFGCHEIIDFTAEFKCALQTFQANKFCRKQNCIYITNHWDTSGLWGYDFQQSTCSNPLQVAFVPLDNLYFAVQPSTG